MDGEREREREREREILMGGVDVEGAEARKGYPHSTERETGEGVAGRRTEKEDVNGKRETLSSAALDHSCPPHLCFVSLVALLLSSSKFFPLCFSEPCNHLNRFT